MVFRGMYGYTRPTSFIQHIPPPHPANVSLLHRPTIMQRWLVSALGRERHLTCNSKVVDSNPCSELGRILKQDEFKNSKRNVVQECGPPPTMLLIQRRIRR